MHVLIQHRAVMRDQPPLSCIIGSRALPDTVAMHLSSGIVYTFKAKQTITRILYNKTHILTCIHLPAAMFAQALKYSAGAIKLDSGAFLLPFKS